VLEGEPEPIEGSGELAWIKFSHPHLPGHKSQAFIRLSDLEELKKNSENLTIESGKIVAGNVVVRGSAFLIVSQTE